MRRKPASTIRIWPFNKFEQRLPFAPVGFHLRASKVKYTVKIENNPSSGDVQTIIRNLIAFNNRHAEPENWQHLAVLVRDQNGGIVGGLDGCTHWGWLYIGRLWVAEALRGQGPTVGRS
jgi:hypothetical protein